MAPLLCACLSRSQVTVPKHLMSDQFRNPGFEPMLGFCCLGKSGRATARVLRTIASPKSGAAATCALRCSHAAAGARDRRPQPSPTAGVIDSQSVKTTESAPRAIPVGRASIETSGSLRLQPVTRVPLTGRLDPAAFALRRLDPMEVRGANAITNSVASMSPNARPVRPSSAQRDLGGLSFSKALHRDGLTKARFRRLGLPPMEKLVDA
jgi:hypothetical protein